MTMTGRPPNTALRFLAVGGSVALLYAILAAIATSLLPLPRAVSSGALWVLCIPVAFGLQRRFTFTARKPHRHGLWLYAATQGLGIGIAASCLAVRLLSHDELRKPSQKSKSALPVRSMVRRSSEHRGGAQ